MPHPQENMRFWHFWLNNFILASHSNPPQFVELLMLTVAIAMLGLAMISPYKPYFVLCLSMVVGASISILVREAIAPSPQSRVTKLTTLLLLFISFYGFIDLVQTL